MLLSSEIDVLNLQGVDNSFYLLRCLDNFLSYVV